MRAEYDSNLSLSYSAYKLFNINHNISTAQLFQTYTHKITHVSTKPQTFYITVKIFLQTKFASKYLMLYRTYQSLSGSQNFSPDSHFEIMRTKIFAQNVFLTSTKSAHSIKICLTVIVVLHVTQTGGSSFFFE